MGREEDYDLALRSGEAICFFYQKMKKNFCDYHQKTFDIFEEENLFIEFLKIAERLDKGDKIDFINYKSLSEKQMETLTEKLQTLYKDKFSKKRRDYAKKFPKKA